MMNNKHLQLEDNSRKNINDILEPYDIKTKEEYKNILYELSSKNINNKENNLILFKKQNDLESHSKIFDIYDNSLKTNNLMGFISYKDLSINIKSRFATSDNKDYFLHYMLCKVFNINITSLENSIYSDYNTFEFVLYILFIYHLKKALNQGLYKKYKKIEYNDSRVCGVINFNKQIRYNTPFNGKICYTTREYSFDNEITQLIRHTIEYLKTKKIFNFITSKEINEYFTQIINATYSYNKRDRVSIINKNIKKLNHPYFYEYEPLRKICLKILRRETFKYESSRNKVNGILFDGAYLWEEYLATILRGKDIIHSKNKDSKNGINLLKNTWRVYPDFYKEERIVLDAKYKRLWVKNEEGEDIININAQDKHQIVSYAYTLNAKKSYFVYPSTIKKDKNTIGKLKKRLECEIGTFGFFIPQNCDSFLSFIDNIKESEEDLENLIL